MTLSKRGDYVVRSALALARAYDGGEARKIRQVVAEMGVPQTFASQILADLVRAGLATSKAGKDGGYRLSRAPGEIALVEVVEAGEGPLRAERCALGDGPCRWDVVCPLHETWRAATDALREVLGATTLADVVATDLAIEQGRVVAPADSHRPGGASAAVLDSVQVEAGSSAVSERLRSVTLVTAALVAAFEQAETLRSSLPCSGPPWSPVEVSASCLPATGGGSGTAGVGVAFEATGLSGAGSHGELTLAVSPLDPERCEVSASGRLRLPPLEAPPAAGEVADRLARVLLRTFLRRLGAGLEEPLPLVSTPVGDPSGQPRRGRASKRRVPEATGRGTSRA